LSSVIVIHQQSKSCLSVQLLPVKVVFHLPLNTKQPSCIASLISHTLVFSGSLFAVDHPSVCLSVVSL